MPRCPWPGEDKLMQRYHDHEWGVPLHNDRKLFEFMVLDAFQAGLSWRTVLHKRKNFKKAFDNFDPAKIAKYSPAKINSLMSNAGIIRNRLKIQGTVKNAQVFLHLQKKHKLFDTFIWQFVNDKPKVNHWKTAGQIPARSKESDAMSEALKQEGFTFVGSTICYAFMQAAGMVNDHLAGCERWRACQIE
ncbi:MAG: DNA-3-methyladenine glycosylase I [Patescibacteria group bacterium]